MESNNFSLSSIEAKKVLTQMTPIEIRNKEFSKSMRGYSCHEVDKFLDLVSKEYEALYAENFELKEKLDRYEQEISHFRQIEDTLKQTMLLAQQTGEEVKQAARHEAELMIKEAEQEIQRKFAEAQVKLDQMRDELEELIRKRELIRTQLKSFLNAHLELTAMYDKEAEKA